uniref:Uncharacterized protein n=1 Tax=Trypanosoma congolense (strain IL3000) TaxID=1068625 RepID=G0UL21_TRYCI|nr:conserved hypothetical protein [Trypanosoma congolense IL3000]
MSSFNVYAVPVTGASASFSSPLMDCTNAIKNSDNIINGASGTVAMKPSATAAFRGHLKVITTVQDEPATPTRRTNDPYRRTSSDGVPCVPRSPFSTEMNFMMSHSDEVRSQFNGNASISFNSSASGSFSIAPQTPIRSLPHHKHAPVVPAAPAPRSAAAVGGTINTGRNGGRHADSQRAAGSGTAPFNAASSSTAGNTSVMRVPCKRVYVNGRPVIVSVNDDGK